MARLNAAAASKNWVSGIRGKGQQNYVDGVRTTEKNWQQNTVRSAGLWEQKIQEAVANHSFQAGVETISNATWQDAAATRGAANWANNTPKAESRYAAAIQPVLQVIQETLPQVEAVQKTSPDASLERVRIMMTALQQAKKDGRFRRRG